MRKKYVFRRSKLIVSGVSLAVALSVCGSGVVPMDNAVVQAAELENTEASLNEEMGSEADLETTIVDIATDTDVISNKEKTLNLEVDEAYLFDEESKKAANEEGFVISADGILESYTGVATNVVIPDGVKKIADSAFKQNETVISVTIPESVAYIDSYAFYGCPYLSNVKISNSITYIGDYAFAECIRLRSANIPKNIVTLGLNCFANTRIITATIPNSLESANEPFVNCNYLEKVFFKDGITSVKESLFKQCTGLKNIEIPESVETIEAQAFQDCVNLQDVQLSSNLKYINDKAFMGCTSLTKIDLPSGISELKLNCFAQSSLESITIPKSLVLSDSPFSNCSNLKKVYFEEGTKTIIKYLLCECIGLEEIDIPDTITTIDTGAFKKCENLKSIYIPDSVVDIKNVAFKNCISMTSVRFPQNLTEIKNEAFLECRSLKTIDLPSELKIIRSSAFENCDGLTSVTLPDSVRIVEGDAFRSCDNLVSFKASSNLVWLESYALAKNPSLTSVTLNEGLKWIGHSAFYKDEALKTITIPNSVNKLDEGVFRDCTSLTKVNLGSGITEIKENSFAGDVSLSEIILPQQVTEIGALAFDSCTALKKITVNSNVKTIDDSAFNGTGTFSMYGVEGSYAEQYAKDNKIDFVRLTGKTTQLEIRDTYIKLPVEKEYLLWGKVTPMDSIQPVTWKSSNPSVATVDEHGVVKVVGVGKSTISVTSGSITKKCVVEGFVPVEKIRLSKNLLAGKEEDTFTLTVQFEPSNATNQNVIWSTSDANVATVTQDGVVTLVGAGTVVITATSEDGEKTAICSITSKALPMLETPIISTLSNSTNGVKVDWNAVDGAVNYRVYKKNDAGKWIKLGDTSSTSFIDTSVVGGNKYTYTVKCISRDGTKARSGYDSKGKTITYLTKPTISALTSTSTGVKIEWGKITGASKYRVYRKVSEGKWENLNDVTSTSYVDTTTVDGMAYLYTIKAIASDNSVSLYDKTGKSITFKKPVVQLNTPVLSAIANVDGGVKVTWNKVTGAENYRLYKKVSDGKWTKVADTTSNSYTDKTVVSGTDYTYTVKCINSDGTKSMSAYDTTGRTIKYLEKPIITAISNTSTGVSIAWGKVTGAAKYRVYRKVSGGSWVSLGDTTAVKYIDKTAVTGTKYTYTIKCFGNDTNNSVSTYDAAGKTITFR